MREAQTPTNNLISHFYIEENVGRAIIYQLHWRTRQLNNIIGTSQHDVGAGKRTMEYGIFTLQKTNRVYLWIKTRNQLRGVAPPKGDKQAHKGAQNFMINELSKSLTRTITCSDRSD